MSIGISCPQAGNNITVHGQGSQGTICVCGSFVESEALRPALLRLVIAVFRALLDWLLRLFGRPERRRVAAAQIIRVRLLGGVVTTGPSPASQPGDCDISPPASPWCAAGMQLPSGSGSGAQFTAFAWLLASDGITIIDGPQSVTFTADGTGTVDCCAQCGSGSADARRLLAGELGSHPRLEVAVPDGPNAGLHRATAVSYLTWELVVRGATYRVAGDARAVLVIRGPSSAAAAAAVEGGPFSATFPGRVFGAAGDVVVTKA